MRHLRIATVLLLLIAFSCEKEESSELVDCLKCLEQMDVIESELKQKNCDLTMVASARKNLSMYCGATNADLYSSLIAEQCCEPDSQTRITECNQFGNNLTLNNPFIYCTIQVDNMLNPALDSIKFELSSSISGRKVSTVIEIGRSSDLPRIELRHDEKVMVNIYIKGTIVASKELLFSILRTANPCTKRKLRLNYFQGNNQYELVAIDW